MAYQLIHPTTGTKLVVDDRGWFRLYIEGRASPVVSGQEKYPGEAKKWLGRRETRTRGNGIDSH